MANSPTIDPTNSPFMVPGPGVAYDTVTVKPGGYMYIEQTTTVTMNILQKTAASATLAQPKPTQKK